MLAEINKYKSQSKFNNRHSLAAILFLFFFLGFFPEISALNVNGQKKKTNLYLSLKVLVIFRNLLYSVFPLFFFKKWRPSWIFLFFQKSKYQPKYPSFIKEPKNIPCRVNENVLCQ